MLIKRLIGADQAHGRKPRVPSTFAGGLKELLRMPMRSLDTVEMGGVSRDSTGFVLMEEGLILG